MKGGKRMPVYKYSFNSSILALEYCDRSRKYMDIFLRNIMIPVPIIILSFFPVCDSLSQKGIWMTAWGVYTGVYYFVILFWLLGGPWICRFIYLKHFRQKLSRKLNKEGLYTVEFYEDYVKEIRMDTTRIIYYNEIGKYALDKKRNLILFCRIVDDLRSFDRINPLSYYMIALPNDIIGNTEIDKLIYFLNGREKGEKRYG